jgi:hypothetical protein
MMAGARQAAFGEVSQSLPHHQKRASFLSAYKAMAEAFYEPVTDRPVVIDKSRAWGQSWEWVAEWLGRQPKMVCMVRDLRSILASMERNYRKNKWWVAGPEDPSKLARMTVVDRLQYWLSVPPVGPAIAMLLDNRQRSVPIFFVRYEDLCSSPKETMQSICEYLELTPHEFDFDNIQKQAVEHNHIFGPYGDHYVRSELKATSNWQDVLIPEIADQIREQYKWFFQIFQY